MRLLVYVPCWINYLVGIEQVESLLRQQEKLNRSGHKINVEFVFSVNAIPKIPKASENQILALGAKYRHFDSNLADVNINLGFLDAVQSEADLFWIVSPGDPVSDTALARIYEYLGESGYLDFIVADEDQRGTRDVTLKIGTLDFQSLSEASFGMVTGVIYRLSKFRPYLHLGVQASFTGWGQLAVLLGGARHESGVTGRILPSKDFYFRGDPKILTHDQKMENLRSYAHSFFGFVILMSILLPNPIPQIRSWVFKNWFRIGSYAKAYDNEKYGYVRLTDLRHLAKVVVAETDILTSCVYSLGTRIDFGGIRRKLAGSE